MSYSSTYQRRSKWNFKGHSEGAKLYLSFLHLEFLLCGVGGRERPENLTWCLAKKNDKVLSSYFSKFNPICWKTLFIFHRGLHGSWRIDRKSGPISCRPHRDTRPYWIYHRFVIPKNCNFFNQRKMSNIKFCLSCLSVVYTDVFSLIYVDPNPSNFFPLLPTKMDFQQIQQFFVFVWNSTRFKVLSGNRVGFFASYTRTQTLLQKFLKTI